MGPRETDIHPPKVKEAGDDLQAAARDARKRLSHSLDSSDTVYANHAGGGWTSAKELADCGHAWEDHVIDLVNEMERLGQDLRDSANGLAGNDHFAQDLLYGINVLGE
ncbi:hypothetical protein [Streptomyces sp. NBC_01477]|uniref:hypothetical protein n=1 Tax=Streptomyces sp. NBC_01477 TaxID=2976015 RepID=UPI002E32AD42|nr:hypothetical protein [Streptomyces sp. NBC_01477]